MVEDRQHRAGDEAHLPRALRGGGEEDDGIGAVAAIAVEIMLDGAHMAVAELVAELGEIEALVPIVLRRFLVRTDVRKELDTEFHNFLPEPMGAARAPRVKRPSPIPPARRANRRPAASAPAI